MASLFDLQYLKQLCKEYRLTPSKKYGQNFLIDEKPIEEMIRAAELSKDDTVIEIGPGFGVLTFVVAPLVKKVVAFEIERKLEPYWAKRLKDQKIGRSKDQGEIEIIWGNALKHVSRITYHVSRGYKVVANLPYQITSKVLQMLLADVEQKPERIVVMVQKEVAERIVAAPPDMSVLAVSVQYYGEPRIVAYVPRESFWPIPDVDSAILAISRVGRVSRVGKEEEQ